ncbi:MAG: Patched family protein, partial [Halapricum sp.]
MGMIDRGFELVTEHSRLAIAAMLVLTLTVGAGASAVEQTSSLDQFQGDTTEAQKLDYVEANFSTGPENTTSVQVIVRDDNVLDSESLSEMLAMQAGLRDDETVNATLAKGNAVTGIPNLVAAAGFQMEIGQQLRTTTAEYEQLNASVSAEQAAIEQRRAQLQKRSEALNETALALRGALEEIQATPDPDVRSEFEQVDANTIVELDDEDFATFNQSVQQLQTATNMSQIRAAYEFGTGGVLAEEYQQLRNENEQLRDRAAELESDVQRLRSLGEELQTLRSRLEGGGLPSLAEQREQLESMNQSEIDAAIQQLFASDSPFGDQANRLMPTYYEPGKTSANATMMIVVQTSEGQMATGGANERLTNAQLALETSVNDAATENDDAIVFGAGKITDEINRSMTDSLAIVGPLALLFVVLALAVAYRDV